MMKGKISCSVITLGSCNQCIESILNLITGRCKIQLLTNILALQVYCHGRICTEMNLISIPYMALNVISDKMGIPTLKLANLMQCI